MTTIGRELLKRPRDATFDSLEGFFGELGLRMARSREIPTNEARIVVEDNQLVVPVNGRNAALTNWSLSQLCKRSEPSGQPGYFSRLPIHCAQQVADIINSTLPRNGLFDSGGKALIEEHPNGPVLRAINSKGYNRVYDVELQDIVTAARNLGGEPAGGSSLYSGDRDSFARLVFPDKKTDLNGDGKWVMPGIIVGNSEVGARSLSFQLFWYELICTNGMTAITKGMRQTRRHVGSVRDLLESVHDTLPVHLNQLVEHDVRVMKAALELDFASTKEDAIDALKKKGFAKKLAERAVQVAQDEFEDLSVYSLVFALTREAREIPFAAERQEAESKASRLFQLAA